MATVRDSLQSINGYPIPQRTLDTVAAERGISLFEELTPDVCKGAEYRLAKADLLKWLCNAPNVSQGGQSYSFSPDQRKRFMAEANAIYQDVGGDADKAGQVYGYKGSRL